MGQGEEEGCVMCFVTCGNLDKLGSRTTVHHPQSNVQELYRDTWIISTLFICRQKRSVILISKVPKQDFGRKRAGREGSPSPNPWEVVWEEGLSCAYFLGKQISWHQANSSGWLYPWGDWVGVSKKTFLVVYGFCGKPDELSCGTYMVDWVTVSIEGLRCFQAGGIVFRKKPWGGRSLT